MWDAENGGFYQYYYPDSSVTVDPSFKLIYGNAFALFALSAYARINKDPVVMEWISRTVNWLENAAHDPVHGGYFNIIVPENLAESGMSSRDAVKRAGWGNPGWKDQNTSIHLLEAFTGAYQVMSEESVRTRLTEMLELIRDTMVHPDGYLRLFFTENWEPVSYRDSSRAFILKNPHFDHISFGHNIETAYLLLDASQTLYGSPDPVTLTVAKKLIDHTLKFGFDQDYYGLYDKGFIFSGEDLQIIDSTKTWWAQAKPGMPWPCLVNCFRTNPYISKLSRKCGPILNGNNDPQYGGWYNNGLDKNPESKKLSESTSMEKLLPRRAGIIPGL
jgi:mannobiose 2-epimerase